MQSEANDFDSAQRSSYRSRLLSDELTTRKTGIMTENSKDQFILDMLGFPQTYGLLGLGLGLGLSRLLDLVGGEQVWLGLGLPNAQGR